MKRGTKNRVIFPIKMVSLGMASTDEETALHSLSEADLREAEIANQLYEEALAEGTEVEIKEGEGFGPVD